MASGKKVTLRSSDGEKFEIEEEVAVEFQTVRDRIADDYAYRVIPLHNVTAKILALVVEYVKKHVESGRDLSASAESDLKAWDEEFVQVDQGTLFDIIMAAKCLNNKSLLDWVCQKVEDMIKGKALKRSVTHSTS